MFKCLAAALALNVALGFPKLALAVQVAVDIGHTQAASGAVSARGIRELDFNRVLAAEVVTALAARGLGVRTINADGLIASLDDRFERIAFVCHIALDGFH